MLDTLVNHAQQKNWLNMILELRDSKQWMRRQSFDTNAMRFGFPMRLMHGTCIALLLW